MRLIDADALISKLKECISIEWNNKCAPVSWAEADANFIDDLENAPTIDAVPVVRCKDCQWGKKWKNAFEVERFKCDLLFVDVSPEAFCSYGERKEG